MGGVLFLAGQAFVASAFLQGASNARATIPAGPAWFYVYRIDILGAGRLEGTFEDVAGRTVDMYVFAARDFPVYEFVGLGNSLYRTQGTAGSFAVGLPGSGTYYLVFDHGTGNEEAPQEVRVSYRLRGIEPEFLQAGLAFVVPGILAVAFGLKVRSRVRPGPAA